MELFKDKRLREAFCDYQEQHGETHKAEKENLVECGVCGCLLKKETAIKGKGEVRTTGGIDNWGLQYVGEEYIYTPYYCKIHQPKKK